MATREDSGVLYIAIALWELKKKNQKKKQLHMFHALSNLCPSSAFAHLGMYW